VHFTRRRLPQWYSFDDLDMSLCWSRPSGWPAEATKRHLLTFAARSSSQSVNCFAACRRNRYSLTRLLTACGQRQVRMVCAIYDAVKQVSRHCIHHLGSTWVANTSALPRSASVAFILNSIQSDVCRPVSRTHVWSKEGGLLEKLAGGPRGPRRLRWYINNIVR